LSRARFKPTKKKQEQEEEGRKMLGWRALGQLHMVGSYGSRNRRAKKIAFFNSQFDSLLTTKR